MIEKLIHAEYDLGYIDEVASAALPNIVNEFDIDLARVLGLESLPKDFLNSFKASPCSSQQRLVKNLERTKEHLLEQYGLDCPLKKAIDEFLDNNLGKQFALDIPIKKQNLVSQVIQTRLTKEIFDLISSFVLKDMDVDDMLAMIITSSCVFGGLAFDECLEQLFYELTSGCPALNTLNGSPFFTLNYKKSGHLTNIRILPKQNKNNDVLYHEVFSSRRWYPDTITKLMMLQYFKFVAQSPPKKITYGKIRSRIYKSLGINQKELPPRLLFSSMFDIGVKLNKVNIPKFIKNFADGTVFSGSTELETIELFCKKQLKQTYQKNIDKPNGALIEVVGREVSLYKLRAERNTELIGTLLTLCEQEKVDVDPENPVKVSDFQARQKLIDGVRSLYEKKDTISLHAEILVAWILDGLNKKDRWGIGKNTAFRYLDAIHEEWSALWSKYDITNVGESEATEHYQHLHNVISKKDSIIDSCLPLLYDFIREKYCGIVALPDDSIGGKRAKGHTRSMLVPEDVFQQVREEIHSNQEVTKNLWGEQIDLILILSYRCGFRPKEIYSLKLSDIDVKAQDCVVRTGKTDSASRLVPLSILLMQNEHIALQQFVTKRRQQATKSLEVSLFSKSIITNEPFDLDSINKHVTKLLTSYCPQRTVFYQFRHTAISKLLLICFGDADMARQITCFSNEKITQIKQYFCADQTKTLYQLSCLFGHLKPKITLTTYSHFTDLILHHCIQSSEIRLDIKKCAKALGMAARTLRKELNIEDETAIETSSIATMPLIDKKLKKYCQKHFITTSIQKVFQPEYANERGPDFEDLQKIISMSNDGSAPEEISSALCVNLSFVCAFLASVDEVHDRADFKTSKGKSTLVRNSGVRYPSPSLQSKDEKNDAYDLFKSLIDNSKITKHKFNVASQILGSSLERSYMIFASPSDVTKVILALKNVVKPERWFITVELNESSQNEIQFDKLRQHVPAENFIISNKMVKDKKYKKGRFYLTFQHLARSKTVAYSQSADKEFTKPYGTKSLKTALFFSLCYFAAFEKIKDLTHIDEPQMTLDLET